MFGFNKKINELNKKIELMETRLGAYEWSFGKSPKFNIGGIIWFRNMNFYLEATIVDISPGFSEKNSEYTFFYEVNLSCPTHYYRSDCIPEKLLISPKIFQNEHKSNKKH